MSTDKPSARECWIVNTDTHIDQVYWHDPGPSEHVDIDHYVEASAYLAERARADSAEALLSRCNSHVMPGEIDTSDGYKIELMRVEAKIKELEAERDQYKTAARPYVNEQLIKEREISRIACEALIRAKGNIHGSIEGSYFQMNKEYLAPEACKKATQFIDNAFEKIEKLRK